MTNADELKAVAADEMAWNLTKEDYAKPNSTVDIGEMYCWANKWHEAAISAMNIRTMTVSEVARVLCEADGCIADAEVSQFPPRLAWMQYIEPAQALSRLGTIRIVEDEK